MGILERYEIKSIETKRVERNFLTTVDYLIKIHVRYTKGDSDEVLGLIRKGDDKIWINGYKVYSDLML